MNVDVTEYVVTVFGNKLNGYSQEVFKRRESADERYEELCKSFGKENVCLAPRKEQRKRLT